LDLRAVEPQAQRVDAVGGRRQQRELAQLVERRAGGRRAFRVYQLDLAALAQPEHLPRDRPAFAARREPQVNVEVARAVEHLPCGRGLTRAYAEGGLEAAAVEGERGDETAQEPRLFPLHLAGAEHADDRRDQ